MSKEGVKVVIMDREFTIACKKNDREDLLDAAAHLDKQLRVVQAQSKVVGLEHCAVITALNLSNELLQLRRNSQVPGDLNARLQALTTRVERAVSRNQSDETA
ncbi:MAG TPA: cell division protein ZapA [Gammaproteobacteria bacterium]|nr:cell division protein ZapA [Gammaproteobacteria bacterium]